MLCQDVRGHLGLPGSSATQHLYGPKTAVDGSSLSVAGQKDLKDPSLQQPSGINKVILNLIFFNDVYM